MTVIKQEPDEEEYDEEMEEEEDEEEEEKEEARAVDNYVKHGTALTPKQDNGKPSTKKLQTQQTSAVRGDQFRKKTNYKFVSKIRTTS